MIDVKECPKCGEELPPTPEFFYRCAKTYDSLQSWCKACHDEYHWGRKEAVRVLARLKRERYDVFTPFVILSGPSLGEQLRLL
jgi:hypothetical protein